MSVFDEIKASLIEAIDYEKRENHFESESGRTITVIANNGRSFKYEEEPNMIYPLMTLDDGTEIVYSDMLPNGKIKVYIEKPVEDGFHNATCYLPGYDWQDINGFSSDEIERYMEIIKSNVHLNLCEKKQT